MDGPSGPEKDFTDLHAWAEVHVPGAGWIGLDPTSGLVCRRGPYAPDHGWRAHLIERKRITRLFQQGINNVAGYVLPLRRAGPGSRGAWQGARWAFRDGSLLPRLPSGWTQRRPLARLQSYEAEGRRIARFRNMGHSSWIVDAPPQEPSGEHPYTLDLRYKPGC